MDMNERVGFFEVLQRNVEVPRIEVPSDYRATYRFLGWFLDNEGPDPSVQCSVALRLGADSRLLLAPEANPSIRFYFTGFLKECIHLYQKPDLFTRESLERVGYMRLDTQILVIGPWRLTGGRQLCLLELEVPSSRYRVIPSSRKI
jgi:hypothetical protein